MKITVFKVFALFLFVILIVVSITSGKPVQNSRKEKLKASYNELVRSYNESKNKTTSTSTIRSVPYNTRSSKRVKKKKVIGNFQDLKKIWKSISTVKPPPTTTTTTTTLRTTTIVENFSDLFSFDVTTFNYEYNNADLSKLGLLDDFNKIFKTKPKKN